MAATLAEKSCTPCGGGVPPLSREAAEEYHRQAPEWGVLVEATRIERTYRFKNFTAAFSPATSIASAPARRAPSFPPSPLRRSNCSVASPRCPPGPVTGA